MRLIDADELQKKLAEMLVDDKLGGKEFIRLYELVREQYVFRVGQYGKWRIDLEELVDASATTDAEPVRHGKWDEQWTARGESLKDIELLFGKCSSCRQWHVALQVTFPYFSKYCPHCGAKMEVE